MKRSRNFSSVLPKTHHAMPLVFFTVSETTIGTLPLATQHLYDLPMSYPTIGHQVLPNPLTCYQGFPGARSSTPKASEVYAVLQNTVPTQSFV